MAGGGDDVEALVLCGIAAFGLQSAEGGAGKGAGVFWVVGQGGCGHGGFGGFVVIGGRLWVCLVGVGGGWGRGVEIEREAGEG